MRYHPGYDSRPRREIGKTVDTLPDILNGIRRIQGWLEVATINNIEIPRDKLESLRNICIQILDKHD